ncbi:MAG: SUMF1/EgtB/PvdO family nonheme iron enzyme [Blastocatellia bacterium]
MDDLKKCNACGNTYPGNVSFCLNDGSPLVPIETMIGTVIDGRYRLDSLIGQGGMGDVYRATHVHIDTQFAVKLLKPEFVANQMAIKRFRLEARAAGRIHHPNAVRVTDFGVTPERIVFLVMELVEGQSLRSLIRNGETREYIRTINIVRQVCGAVDAAHHSGVIHRDLKPDNILIEKVSDAERVKVLDFGIAKLREAKTDAFLTQAGTIIGTPQYMSPEQCQNKPLDPRSDIYSIGILLYEMLSGEVPFDGESTLQVVYNQLHLPPRPLMELSPHLPVQLAQVIMRALEKEPEDRQSSALELSDELKKSVEHEGGATTFSLIDPKLTRPLMSAEARRTPQSEIPTGEEQSDDTDSATLERRPASDRKTAVVSRQSAGSDTARTRVEAKGAPPTDETSPTARKTADAGAPTNDDRAAEGIPRWRIPAIAALVLTALIAGTIYYLGRKPAQTVSETQRSTAPPGMVSIPGGKFIMGRNDGSPDEGPAHEVEIKPFFLDIREVTNQDYKRFVDATGRAIPKHWKFNGSYSPDEAMLPVTHVTWDDATSYAAWENKRLPAEAEWEYAARGGAKGHLYPWGNQWKPGQANVDRKGQIKPAPVRSFENDISDFGVYDMAGNVSEWVQDYYAERYGGRPDQRFRVYRGGNFLDAPDKSTTTYRWADFPTEIPQDQILRVGFRCARNIE